MPHVSSTGAEDLASTDEVKVYHDEGDEQEEQRTSEDISEVKLGLVTETEQVTVDCCTFSFYVRRSQNCFPCTVFDALFWLCLVWLGCVSVTFVSAAVCVV